MLLIATTFGLLALVWTAVAIRYGGFIVGCLLVIAAGSCLGHSFFHWSVLTLDRALLVALCGLYVIYRHGGHMDPKPFSRTDGLLAVLLAVLLFSTFSHDWRLDDAQPASRFLFLYCMPATLYWLARQSPLSDRQIRGVLIGLSGFAIYLSLTAMAEVVQAWALVWPRYIMTSEYREFLGRGRGPFLNPAANGLYMTAGLGCLWAFWPHSHRVGRGLVLLGSVIIVAGTVLTLTRCVWLGTALALLLMITANLHARARWGVLTLTTCLAIAGLSVGWKSLVAFKRDTNLSAAQTAQSAQLRPMLAAVGWRMFLDQPLCGVGLGQYKQHDARYIATRAVDLPLDRVRPYHQHNVILSLMTETGLAGTVPFLVLLVWWSRTAWMLWTNRALHRETRQLGMAFLAAVISYLASGMFQDVALIPMTNLLLFFLAGLVVSVTVKATVVASARHEAPATSPLLLSRAV